MLTHDEQILWKLVRENGYLWRGRYDAGQWTWTTDESSLIYERLRESWDAFVAVARGDAEKSLLPVWRRDEPRKPRDPMDEEIPF
jgi:hypothetical protein